MFPRTTEIILSHRTWMTAWISMHHKDELFSGTYYIISARRFELKEILYLSTLMNLSSACKVRSYVNTPKRESSSHRPLLILRVRPKARREKMCCLHNCKTFWVQSLHVAMVKLSGSKLQIWDFGKSNPYLPNSIKKKKGIFVNLP